MGILAWIVFGLIAGAVAKLLRPGPGGWIASIIIGIIGAFVGGWIASLFGASGVTGFNLKSFIWAIVGAIVVLAIYHAIVGKKS